MNVEMHHSRSRVRQAAILPFQMAASFVLRIPFILHYTGYPVGRVAAHATLSSKPPTPKTLGQVQKERKKLSHLENSSVA